MSTAAVKYGGNKMELKFRTQEDVGIIEVVGRLDAANTWEFKSKFTEYLTRTNRFVLNLEGLESLDSAGLSEIVSCLKVASEVGGDIKIVRLQQEPRMLFETTRADRIFDMYDEVDSAVDSYSLLVTG
jgi:anti-sigma B factor antagonist